jgi:FkbM family methyltransferase
VRVQSGISKGLWIRISLPHETKYWRGIHESRLQNLISSIVQPGTVVYDIGAHVGSIALGVARLVGGTGKVVAFEGDPENVQSLRESIALNHFGHCMEVVHAAVWSHAEPDGIAFRRSKTHGSHGGVEADGCKPVLPGDDLIRVPAITLNEFIANHGSVPDLIKIDVEGGEYEVLNGGSELFQTRRPRLLVEVHHQEAAEKIKAWLEEYRYSANWDIPREGFPRILFAWPAEVTQRKLADL